MEPNKTYHVALLMDSELTMVALSYGKRTRVERIEDIGGGLLRTVQLLQDQGIDARMADRDSTEWARMIWNARTRPDYAEQ